MHMHLPYDGSARLFQIGIRPLDPAGWIVVDDRLPEYLDEKDRLRAHRPDEVFLAEPGTESAQAEVLALLTAHLVEQFPALYQRSGDTMVVAGRSISLNDTPHLLTAARLVQEDLLLLRRDEAGWRLVAGSLSFPSSWSLREKFGRLLHDIHAPVPGFGMESRNAQLIARMFDKARPETPMLRWNWSLYGDDRLFHPDSAGPGTRRFGAGERAENVFLRVERQTLRKLPASGDMLFTVRIVLDPLAELEKLVDGPSIATALIDQLQALDAAQLDYKGLTLERDRVIARLSEIAQKI
jgi:hypothetical protein